MKMTMSLSLLVFLLISLGEGPSVRSLAGDEGLDRMQALEKILREADIAKIEKEKLGGRTGPWLITLENGAVIQHAVFRHVDRRRPLATPDSYKYDIAAYELTKLLGIELIPPVVERKVQGRLGSLQVFLENCIREKDRKRKKLEPPDPKEFSNALEGTKVFEILTYDECQDAYDLFVHREDWRVCRVDFSEAFAPVPGLLPGCGITVCSRKLYEGLLNLDAEAVQLALGGYLSQEEIGALLIRKGLLIEKIKNLISEKGEDAVLF